MRGEAGTPAGRPEAVLCMAAGQSQLVVARKARELGYAVIGVDRNPEAPAFALCDEVIVASTYEAGPIVQALGELLPAYRLVGVLNRSSGFPVITTAEICAAFGLPGPTPVAAETLTSKSLLMAACREAGIRAPEAISLAEAEEPDAARVRFPCVVKPALSLVGKSGVRVVEELADLAGALAEARAVSLNGLVNIEQWVPGRDLSLLAVIEKGRVHPIVLRDELNRVQPDGGILFRGIAAPSLFSGKAEEGRVLELAGQVARVFDLDRTAISLSCRCEPGGQPVLIETHLDLGGDLFFEGLLPACTSSDVLGLMIRFLTGATDRLPVLDFQPAALVFTPGADRSYRILRGPELAGLEDQSS